LGKLLQYPLERNGKIMEKILNDYLDKIEKHLKPIAVSERVDIIKEIKSEMLELQSNGLSEQQILERLGNPKEMAKAYLGDLLTKENEFSWNKFLTVCAFYSVVGFSGMFVIPCLVIVAPVFIVTGIIAPLLGAVKMIDYIFRLGIPYMDHIGIVFYGVGGGGLNPVVEFICSLPIGILLFWAGRGAWKLLISYCKKISGVKNSLSL